MPYSATVLRVLIASPSDVAEARDAVERALHSWNDANSRSRGVVLMPWRWESSAVPVLGDHPQKLINLQGVDDSDIVIALFGGRLGAPTADAVSGTAEEIERAVGSGKPVHLYFSSAPLPNDIDTDQLIALREFKAQMKSKGILGEFSNPDELLMLVWQAVGHDLLQFNLGESASKPQTSNVDLLLQLEFDEKPTSSRRDGTPRFSKSWRIEVTNRGSRDAEGVTFESLTDRIRLHGTSDPIRIHSGQTRRIPVTMLGGFNKVIRVSWLEGNERQEKDFEI